MLSNKIYTAVNLEPIQLTSTPGIDLNAGMRRESSDSQAGVDIFAAAYSQALKNCQRVVDNLASSDASFNSTDEEQLKNKQLSVPFQSKIPDVHNLSTRENKSAVFKIKLQQWVDQFKPNTYGHRRRAQAQERIIKCIENRENPIPLDLGSLSIDSLPEVDWSLLDHVCELNLENNLFSELPAQMAHMKNLTGVSINHNYFEQLPSWLTGLDKLIVLSAFDNLLSSLPENFAKNKVVKLDISRNRFTEVPRLSCDIRHCNISYNAIPLDDLSPLLLETIYGINKLQFKALTPLSITTNSNDKERAVATIDDAEYPQESDQLSRILDQWKESVHCRKMQKDERDGIANRIMQCHHLKGKKLILTHASAVPEDAIAKLKHLEFLYIQKCNIRTLPSEYKNLENLTSIDISGCRLKKLPSWLDDMPKLTNIQAAFCNLGKNTGVSSKIETKFFNNYATNNILYDNQIAWLSDEEDIKDEEEIKSAPDQISNHHLSEEDKGFLDKYITNSDYIVINGYLRSKRDKPVPAVDQTIEDLTEGCNSALKKLLTKGCIAKKSAKLYRSSCLPDLEVERIRKSFAAGVGYQPHQFVSTSSCADFPRNVVFSKIASPGEQNVFFVIRNSYKLAADIELVEGISQRIGENIFPYETTFRITNIKKNGTFLQVDMEAAADLNSHWSECIFQSSNEAER